MMKAFSPEWASAYEQAIQANDAYSKASTKWELGKLAFVLDANSPAILLDLHQGQCLAVQSLSAAEAEQAAAFVIVAEQAVWEEVLSGQLAPLMGLMRGKLKLSKGSIAKLMPFTNSATELVKSAQNLETEF